MVFSFSNEEIAFCEMVFVLYFYGIAVDTFNSIRSKY